MNQERFFLDTACYLIKKAALLEQPFILDMENYWNNYLLYFAVRLSLITPFQFSPNPKSYTLPSESVWHFIS